MSARDELVGVIGPKNADEALTQFAFAGYRILAPGELDVETVERCAKVAEGEGNTWSGSRDLDQALQEAAVDEKCADIATAIRSLTEGQGRP